MKYLAILRVLLLLGAGFATSTSRKHLVSRFWPPTTAVWRTRRPHTLHQERPSISRAIVACEAVAVRKRTGNVQLGGCFVSHFVYPKFRPTSTTAAAQSRHVGLC